MAYVQSNTANTGTTSTPAVTLGSSTPVNHSVAVMVEWQSSAAGDTVTCADNAGNTYTQVGGNQRDATNLVTVAVFNAPITVSGTLTVTCTISASRTATLIQAVEVDNKTLDATAITAFVTTSTFDSGAATSTVASDTGIGLNYNEFNSGPVFTPETNWTQPTPLAVNGSGTLLIEYLNNVGAAGAYDATWTNNTGSILNVTALLLYQPNVALPTTPLVVDFGVARASSY